VRAACLARWGTGMDLLLLPIGWTRRVIEESIQMMDLLQPKRVIPMHYWSPQEKNEFLQLVESRGAGYRAGRRVENAQDKTIRILDVSPAPFTGWIMDGEMRVE
jgi:L-ascorbate metabolism protein UlaG (beta-lactamase superfamily)